MNESLIARRQLLQSLLAGALTPIGVLSGCGGGGGEPSPPSAAQPKPLAMFYRYASVSLEATRIDLHATLSNVGVAADRFGVDGLSHRFDGRTSSAQVDRLQDVAAGDFAISFWQQSSSTVRMQAVALSGAAGESLTIEFNHQHAISVRWNDVEQSGLTGGAPGELTNGAWHHVLVQRSGQTLELFVDGARYGTAASSGPLRSSDLLLVGGTSTARWNGVLDDVRLHDRAFAADLVPQMVYQWSLVKASNRADSLAGYYPFNGNAVDETGHGVDGVLHQVTPASDRFGNAASAYSFDGMNSYIELDDTFDPIATDFAIAFWMRTASSARMIAFSVSPGGCSLDFVLDSQTGLEIIVNGGVRIASGNAVALADDRWHFILLQRVGDKLQLYIDGVVAGTAVETSTLFGPGSVVRFGKASDAAGASVGANWSGLLDDVQIYVRTFTAPEMKALETQQFRPRDGAGVLAFDGKMWLLGGWNPDNVPVTSSEVWCSTDGFTWTLVCVAPWEGRHVAGWVVFAGRMWVVGGDSNSGHYQNDVWSSADGVQWDLATRTVPWADRATHYCLSFSDRLWLMGGQKLGVPGEPLLAYNDVYSSTDGSNWRIETPHAAWSERGLILGSVVFKGQMWVIGGGTYDVRTYLNDVWSSSDGIHWERVVEQAPWTGRQYHNVIVFDEKIWVIAGSRESDTAGGNDVWYSTNGASWTQLVDAPWAERHAASCVAHRDKLWMTCGSSTRLYNDIWRLGYAP